MDSINKIKQIILLIGDVAILYITLAVVLFVRYGDSGFSDYTLGLHLLPFTILFALWLVIFYIGGLYDLQSLRNGLEFTKKFAANLLTAGFFGIIYFYLISGFGIAPRASLLIFLVIFGVISYLWRRVYNYFLGSTTPQNNILLVGYNRTTQELADCIASHPQLGYEIKFWMKEGLHDKEFDHLSQIILANKINLIVVPAHIKKNSRAARLIYKNLVLGIEVQSLADLYENLLRKVPIAELEEVWFLENIAKSHKIYELFKRPMEIALAIIIGILTLPLVLLIASYIKMVSPGAAIFSQKRVGQNEKEFTIYKFRTMQPNAEKNGPQWADLKDKRVIPLGNVLRRAHLDELPQLINILRGDLSLVGPRPERPEFVSQLKKEISYYELRHLVRPGVTGWGQINYRYGSSIEDAYEKLQYDIYYLKNRSVWLDTLIVIKTLRLLFIQLR